MRNKWTDILSATEIADYHARTAELDPAYARREREWFESRTKQQLRSLESRTWTANDADTFQLARSYLALHA